MSRNRLFGFARKIADNSYSVLRHIVSGRAWLGWELMEVNYVVVQRAADMEARSPLLMPLLFFGPPSSRGVFFVQKYVFSPIKQHVETEKRPNFLFFSRMWQYCHTVERLVSLNAVIKTVSPVSPCWLHHPPLSRGFFFPPFITQARRYRASRRRKWQEIGPWRLKSLENPRSIR